MKISIQLSLLLLYLATSVDAKISSPEGNFHPMSLTASFLRTKLESSRYSDSTKARVHIVSRHDDSSGTRTRSLLEKEKNSQFAMDVISKNPHMLPSVSRKASTRRILEEELPAAVLPALVGTPLMPAPPQEPVPVEEEAVTEEEDEEAVTEELLVEEEAITEEGEDASFDICLASALQLAEDDAELGCVCEELDDGATLLSCAVDCEFCDAGEEICFTEKTTVLFDANGTASDLTLEVDYTSGLSFDVDFTRGENGTCDMSIDGTMCTSCVIESCGEPSLNCSNIAGDGTVVDLCAEGVVASSPFYAFAVDTFECTAPNRSAPVACSDAIPLEADGSVVVASNTESEATASDSCAVAIGATVYYTVVGNGNRFRATTCTPETNFDTVLAVRSGTCDDRSCVGTDDDSGCGFNVKSSTFDWDTEEDMIYYIVVGGFSEVILEDSVEVTVAQTGTFGLRLIDLDAPADEESRTVAPMESCSALTEEYGGDSSFDCSCSDTSTSEFSSAVLLCDNTCEVCSDDGSTCGIESFSIGLTDDEVVWGIGSQLIYTSGSDDTIVSLQNYSPSYCVASFVDGSGALNYCDCELNDCAGEMVPSVDCTSVGNDSSFSLCGDPDIESGPFQYFSSSGFDSAVCAEELPVVEIDEATAEALQLTPPSA